MKRIIELILVLIGAVIVGLALYVGFFLFVGWLTGAALNLEVNYYVFALFGLLFYIRAFIINHRKRKQKEMKDIIRRLADKRWN